MSGRLRRRLTTAVVVALAAVLVLWRSDRLAPLGGWLAAQPAIAGPLICEDCNVVLVLADTLRADHLASYGYARVTSPHLDRLARRGVQFLNVRSQSACTFPSVNSLLTSRPTFEFLDPVTRPGIPRGIPTLAEILRQRGYGTAALSASPIVRRSPGPQNPVGGFGHGFEHFDDTLTWCNAERLTRGAVEVIEDLDEPFFLYLHYMDPHDPLVPDREHRGTFGAAYRGPWPFVERGDLNPIRPMIENGSVAELGAADVAHLIALYDESILTFDSGFQTLLDYLTRKGLIERTIVVVAADHGESFLEHGSIKHCYTVYEPETRVPLVIHLPGLDGPRRLEPWVQNLDLVPTLLDYLGLPLADASFAGRSLRPLIERGRPPGRYAFSAMAKYRSVNDERHKLIHDLNRRRYLLFDLVADPGEEHSLLARERGIFRRLRGELEAWTAQVEGGLSDEERLRQAEGIEEQLRALGYL